ncbi:hypothetical protein LguiA_021007 [Lonicera macranthoides]
MLVESLILMVESSGEETESKSESTGEELFDSVMLLEFDLLAGFTRWVLVRVWGRIGVNSVIGFEGEMMKLLLSSL